MVLACGCLCAAFVDCGSVFFGVLLVVFCWVFALGWLFC